MTVKTALEFLADEELRCEGIYPPFFLDLKLPHVRRTEDSRGEIRSDSSIRDVPVIVMTSSNAEEDLELCRELGVYSFVQKPLTFTSFAKAFADCFHARRQMAEAAQATLEKFE